MHPFSKSAAACESVRPGARDDAGVPGEDAEKPTEIPARGWLQIVKRGWAEAKVDQVPLLSAGVAYYAFLALFPAMIAIVSIYGLIADPGTIATQISTLGKALPGEASQLITDHARYNEIVNELQEAARSNLIFGLHVHVGMENR